MTPLAVCDLLERLEIAISGAEWLPGGGFALVDAQTLSEAHEALVWAADEISGLREDVSLADREINRLHEGVLLAGYEIDRVTDGVVDP